MKVVIIGCGPAGMLAGMSAADAPNDVTILEKMNSVRKKIIDNG